MIGFDIPEGAAVPSVDNPSANVIAAEVHGSGPRSQQSISGLCRKALPKLPLSAE